MEVSKEYRLLKQNIDFAFLDQTIQKLHESNSDIEFKILDTIPEDLIDAYVNFSIHAERNTPGLLRKGETTKISVNYIKTRYNLRSSDKFYFDVLAFDNNNNIVGKLNSWGFKHGGPFYIFHLYVSDSFRGRKIATLLLLKTIKMAVDNIPDLSKFELQTHKSNAATQKIIAKLRFDEK